MFYFPPNIDLNIYMLKKIIKIYNYKKYIKIYNLKKKWLNKKNLYHYFQKICLIIILKKNKEMSYLYKKYINSFSYDLCLKKTIQTYYFENYLQTKKYY